MVWGQTCRHLAEHIPDDLEQTKAKFVAEPKAVAVIANRYDGIDFPGDDCRLLFVEGLPKATNLQERFLMTRMGANLLFNSLTYRTLGPALFGRHNSRSPSPARDSASMRE